MPTNTGPGDYAQVVATAVAAAMKPIQEKLETPIMRMQRQLEQLQAEFVAIRDDPEADDEAMAQALEDSAAKRLGDDGASGRATRARRGANS